MDFQKNEKNQLVIEDDAYMKDITNKMKIKQSQGIIDNRFRVFYQDSDEGKDKWVSHRMKRSINIWVHVFLIAATAKTIYPISVKLIRKHLKVKGFLNLNMAAFPPIIISSAIVCGLYQGAINVYEFQQELEDYSR